MEFELAVQKAEHSAIITQVHCSNVIHRLEHLNHCAQVLLAKSLRFLKE